MKYFTNVLEGRVKNEGAMKEFLSAAGFGTEELAVLNKVSKRSMKDPFYGDEMTLFDVGNILYLKDDEIASLIRPLESADDAKKRLYFDTREFIQSMTDVKSARPTLRGGLVPQSGSSETQTLANLVLKFSNIALSQQYNANRAIAASAGLNPNMVGGHLQFNMFQNFQQSPAAAMEMMATTLAGGVAYMWFNDMRRGNTPRDLTPMNLAEAMLFSNHGGTAALLYNMFRYNDGGIGVPALAATKSIKNLGTAVASGDERRIKRATRQALRYVPAADMWWNSAIRDYAARKWLIEDTMRQRRQLRERGQERLLK